MEHFRDAAFVVVLVCILIRIKGRDTQLDDSVYRGTAYNESLQTSRPGYFCPTKSGPVYQYNDQLAKRLARMCKVVYSEDRDALFEWRLPTCVKYLAEFTLEGLICNKHTGGRAIVGYDATLASLVVAFRGNSNRENWLNSLDMDKVPPASLTSKAEAGEVHDGFLTIYESIRGQVMAAIDEVLEDHPDAPLHVTGHSMGGTQAILLAVDVAQRFPKKEIIMYNFGSPRVGNGLFTRYYKQRVPKTIRVVHTADPVTHVPPAMWPSNYEHMQSEYLDESKFFSHLRYLGIHMTRVGEALPAEDDRRNTEDIQDDDDEDDDDVDELDVPIKLTRKCQKEQQEVQGLKNAHVHTTHDTRKAHLQRKTAA